MFPRILHIYGPLWINSYGTLIAIGLAVFIAFSYRSLVKKKKLLTSSDYSSMIMWGIFGAYFGGRLYEVITQWPEYQGNILELFLPWVSGFGILGSILGVLVSISVFLKMNRKSVLSVFDEIALYTPLLQAFSRVGCFLAGCCYGLPALGSVWAVTYTNPVCFAPLNIPLHPTQLYSTILSLFIFAALFYLSRHRYKKAGDTLFFYIILETGARALVELLRGDRIYVGKQSLSSAHIAALVLAGIGVSGLAYNRLVKRG